MNGILEPENMAAEKNTTIGDSLPSSSRIVVLENGRLAKLDNGVMSIKVLPESLRDNPYECLVFLGQVFDCTPPGIDWAVDFSGAIKIPIAILGALYSYRRDLLDQGGGLRIFGIDSQTPLGRFGEEMKKNLSD